MKIAFLVGAAVALVGCDRIELAKQAPPRVVNGIEVDSGIDMRRVIRETAGLTPACKTRLLRDGLAGFSLPIDQCFKMQEPKRWRGLWRAQFEGSQFCPEPATICDPMERHPEAWLDGFDDVPRGYVGDLYRVEFVGRRTAYSDKFGHGGSHRHHMIVDRPISIEKVKDERDPF